MDINLQRFLILSLVMAILIVLLFIINAIFAKKIAANIRYFMWVVIMLGLLLPFRPTIGDGIIDIPDFTATLIEITEPQMPEIDSVITQELPEMPLETPEQGVEGRMGISFQMFAFIIWGTVATGIVWYHVFQYIRFQRSIKRWGELEEDTHTLELFEHVKQEMSLEGRKVKLVVCGFVTTSMLSGFLKPLILLPERNYDDDELELIFKHELIHYRRKDLWIKLLSVIAIAIHWFNPLVYLMNIALQIEGEASCDQKVLEMSDLKSRHFYAEVIIGMIGGRKLGMTTLATNFYGGKKGIKKRLEEIMVRTVPQKFISYMFLILIFILTIMSGSVFAMQTTYTVPNINEPIVEDNIEIFELAITVVGGGVVDRYYQLNDEIMRIYIVYSDETYRIEMDVINHAVIGLEFYRGVNDSDIDNDVQDTNEMPQTSEISSEQAVEIAMFVAPGRLVEVSRDWENGRPAWWIEIRYNGMVHEFYIDMETGAILDHEFEIDD